MPKRRATMAVFFLLRFFFSVFFGMYVDGWYPILNPFEQQNKIHCPPFEVVLQMMVRHEMIFGSFYATCKPV